MRFVSPASARVARVMYDRSGDAGGPADFGHECAYEEFPRDFRVRYRDAPAWPISGISAGSRWSATVRVSQQRLSTVETSQNDLFLL